MIRAKRVVIGLTVAAFVVGLVAVDAYTETTWATCGLIIAALTIAMRESYQLLGRAELVSGGTAVAVIGTAALLLIRAGAEPLQLDPTEARAIVLVGFATLAMWPVMAHIARGHDDAGPQPRDLARAAAGAFPIVHVGLLGGFLLEMRLLGGRAPDMDVDAGLALLLLVVASVKIGDSCAYFVGRTFGRHPMCWVSPKKTWEGSAASALAGVAVAVLIGVTLGYDPRMAAGLGLIASLAGQGGDLLESYLKRALGVKDSAATFGEMGGILDVLDAPLLAVPAAYLWIQLVIVRGLPG